MYLLAHLVYDMTSKNISWPFNFGSGETCYPRLLLGVNFGALGGSLEGGSWVLPGSRHRLLPGADSGRDTLGVGLSTH